MQDSRGDGRVLLEHLGEGGGGVGEQGATAGGQGGAAHVQSDKVVQRHLRADL